MMKKKRKEREQMVIINKMENLKERQDCSPKNKSKKQQTSKAINKTINQQKVRCT